ncbi:MAG: hypothetical protein KAS36_09410 [Anaerolineales bacterium]|nr:hypothetical protein [Anaerolineales bacterium]
MTKPELEVLKIRLTKMEKGIEESRLVEAAKLSGMKGLQIIAENQRSLIDIVQALVDDKIEETESLERLVRERRPCCQ